MTVTATFEIRNQLGLHARPAAKLVGVAKGFRCAVTFERDGVEVDGKSLLDVLTLACAQGTHVTIRAAGADAAEAVAALGMLIEDKFGEP